MGFRFNIDLFDGSKNSKVMAALGVLAGFLIAVYGGMDYMEQNERIQGSEKINVTVTDVSVVEQTSSSRHGTSMEYAPILNFEYSYSGENYSSDNFYPTDSDFTKSNREAAGKVTDDYTTGSQVQAYVDPENPGEAFLRKENSRRPLMLLVFGAAMILLGTKSLLNY